jgi:hypothetical protein
MNDDPDPRHNHGEDYGSTISLRNLKLRWRANEKLINRICFEGKLKPKLSDRWIKIKKERGKPPLFLLSL